MFATVAIGALAACGGDDSDASATGAPASTSGDVTEVTIETFNFQPDPVTVPAGTTISFRNLDKINHSVTAGTREAPAAQEFDGLMKNAGDTFELTLDEPGTYDYFCSFHPGEGMTGQIIVE